MNRKILILCVLLFAIGMCVLPLNVTCAYEVPETSSSEIENELFEDHIVIYYESLVYQSKLNDYLIQNSPWFYQTPILPTFKRPPKFTV